MSDKPKPHYILNPEKENKGVLLWLNLTAAHFGELFFSNLIAILCLVPAGFFLFLFIDSLSLQFQLISALLFALAGPALTLFFGTACRVSIRQPVWVWEDLKSILKHDLWKSFGLGLICAVMWSVIIDACYLMYTADGGLSPTLMVFAGIYVFLISGFTIFSFQQLAMLDITFPQVLKNGVLLIFAGGARSFLAIIVMILPLGLCAYFYGVGSVAAVGGIPAWVAMSSQCIFAPVFRRIFMGDGTDE